MRNSEAKFLSIFLRHETFQVLVRDRDPSPRQPGRPRGRRVPHRGAHLPPRGHAGLGEAEGGDGASGGDTRRGRGARIWHQVDILHFCLTFPNLYFQRVLKLNFSAFFKHTEVCSEG